MSVDPIQDAIDRELHDLDRETLLMYIDYQDMLIKMLLKSADKHRLQAQINKETIMNMQRMDS